MDPFWTKTERKWFRLEDSLSLSPSELTIGVGRRLARPGFPIANSITTHSTEQHTISRWKIKRIVPTKRRQTLGFVWNQPTSHTNWVWAGRKIWPSGEPMKREWDGQRLPARHGPVVAGVAVCRWWSRCAEAAKSRKGWIDWDQSRSAITTGCVCVSVWRNQGYVPKSKSMSEEQPAAKAMI